MKAIQIFIAAGAIATIGNSPGWAQEEHPQSMPPMESERQEFGSPNERMSERDMERSAQSRQMETRQQQAQEKADSFRASTLIGSRVVNNRSERLGNVSDLAVDLETGEVAYVIVSAGGLVGGVGGELRPVPPNRFQVRAVDNLLGGVELIMDMEKERWERAPAIRQNELAKLDQEKTTNQIHEFYGQQSGSESEQRQFGTPDRPQNPEMEMRTESEMRMESERHESELQLKAEERSPEEQPTEFGAPRRENELPAMEEPEYRQEESQSSRRMREPAQSSRPQATSSATTEQAARQAEPESRFSRASDLIGTDVRNEQHEQVGEIEDLLVNLGEGQLSFVTIVPHRESFWQMPMENYAISADSLDRLGQNEWILSLSNEQLEDAKVVTERELQTAQAGSADALRVEVQPGRPAVYGGRDYAPEQR